MSIFVKTVSSLVVSVVIAQSLYAETVLDNVQSVTYETGCLLLKNNIRYGTTDRTTEGEVSNLQQFLKGEKYLSGNTTGFFGTNTRNAVKVFQKKVIPVVRESDIDTTIVPSASERRILTATGFRLSNTGLVGKYTRAKIAYITCHDTKNTSTVSTGTNVSKVTTLGVGVLLGSCYFDEAAYRSRGFKMTVTPSDGAAWISTNNMILSNGKLYLRNKPGIMWNLWDTATNKLSSAMLSCKDGVISETGMPVAKKVLTAEELAVQNEADIQLKCTNGTYPPTYAICQPKEKRLQYLKDQFAQTKKPMSLATVSSFGPGFADSELAFADWKYVTVGPFVVSCDELITKYDFSWLRGEGGTLGNWAPNSNRDFYSDGKFIGSGGAAIHTTQYKDKVTGEAMTEPDVSYEAIGYCNHSGVVATTTAPTLNLYRTEVNNEQTLSWSTKNVTSLAYSCLDSNNKSTGDIPVPVNCATTTESWENLRQNGWSGTYYCSWKANGTTVVATESFTIGK